MSEHKSLWQAYNDLDGITRAVIALTALAGTVFAVVAVVGVVKNAKDVSGEKQQLNTSKSELKKLNDMGIKQSWPDSQYLTWANNMQDALQGCSIDAISMLNVLGKLNNDADWLKLSEAFGIREVKGCALASNRKVTLQGALSWKLIGDEIENVNAYLKKRGIRYKV
jgi:hypothetical protein